MARKKSLSSAERISIAQMAEVGTPISQMAKALRRSPQTVKNAVADAKLLIRSNAIFYVERHLQATAVAAAAGNASPAQWAMEKIGVVEPAKAAGQAPAMSVRIGVMLPGLGANAVTLSGRTPEDDENPNES